MARMGYTAFNSGSNSSNQRAANPRRFLFAHRHNGHRGNVMSNYPWQSAPDWARYAATDYDGFRYWYEHRPHADGRGFWLCDEAMLYAGMIPAPAACPGWQDTLEEKPSRAGGAS